MAFLTESDGSDTLLAAFDNLPDGDDADTADQGPETEEVAEAPDDETDEVETEEADDEESDDEVETEEADDEESEADDETEEADDETEDDDPESSYLYTDEESGEKVFLTATDPETGEASTYYSREKAQEGLQRQLNQIGKLKAERDSVREELGSENTALKDEIAIYRQTLTKESAMGMMVRSRLPEDLQGVDPKTLDEADYRKYVAAEARAEAEIKAEIEKANRENADRAAELEAKEKAAADHVRAKSRDFQALGINNAEDRMAFGEMMTTKPDDSAYTPEKMAELIAIEFGDAYADRFIASLASDFQKGASQKVVEKAKSVKAKVKTKAKKPTGSTKTKKSKGTTDGSSTLDSVYATNAKRRKRR